MNKETVRVELGERSYDVVVGAGLLTGLPDVLEPVAGSRGWKRAFVVTDSNVAPLYLDAAGKGLGVLGLEVSSTAVEAGERSKSTGWLLGLLESFAGSSLERTDLVVALGGGVVGDLAGFAASVFKRGLDVVQLPTTLMAQVDSAIGGKTAVDLEAGKNLAGTFHQPAAVLCDVGALGSLPDREYTSGLAEVAKYRFIEPSSFPQSYEGSLTMLKSRDEVSLVQVVARCAAVKARVVSLDEFDRGPRAVLNYGHTLGHALEAASGYGEMYTHGEAVAVGMVFAAHVAEERGVAPVGTVGAHREFLEGLGLPTRLRPPEAPFDDLAFHMAQDKKNRGSLAMVLIGRDGPYVERDLKIDTLRLCYERILGGD
jgi:3-dehydroquinate synthase